jgi:tRNA 2-thiouridine synthesizing protein A
MRAAHNKGDRKCRALHDMNDPTPLLVSAHLADARGKACPAPIIDLAKALRSHPLVELWADDPAAGADVLAFCAATGHVLVQASEEGRLLRALVRQRASAV